MNFDLDYDKYENIARKVVSEGAVLLRNEDGALPLSEGTRVALFGRMQKHYYRSGSGSGGMVNAPTRVSLFDAFMEEERVVLDEQLIKVYENWEKQNPYEKNKGYGLELWSQEEMPVTREMAAEFAAKNDAAVIIIARTAGEDRDNLNEEGSYTLRKEEEELISNVCSTFDRAIVVLNIGNVIDMSFVEKYKPQAVLLAWQGGMMGAYGTVDALVGRECPTGHLTDTIARDISDYPANDEFGNDAIDLYKEDIYVGYRYFETFAKDKVMYPFGFGLTYTEFEISTKNIISDENSVTVCVTVKNVGKLPSKEVVQMYSEAPQGLLGKPSRTLVGFIKTPLVKPGEAVEISVTADINDFYSYDDTGRVAKGFVLEKGNYNICIGSNVRDVVIVGSINISEDKKNENVTFGAMKPVKEFDRLKAVEADGKLIASYEQVPLRTFDVKKHTPKANVYDSSKKYSYVNLAEGEVTMDEFIQSLPDEDLISIVRGEGMRSKKVTPGTAAAFGGVNEHLKEIGMPCGCCDDGPSGMRLDSGMRAFSLPNGTMIASTFNEALVEELYTMTGIEMRKNEVDVLLGPGMNIHRHPYNGRNFEYLSEDPLVSGRIAAAQIRALQSVGVDGVLKHFCGNNQEKNRYTLDSVISERALREIYLKGFEIAVRNANPHYIMTTYGRVNGMWTSNDYELTQSILRDDWGFDGMVMTDWWAAINTTDRYEEAGKEGSKTNFAAMINASNDIYMCCPDSSKNGHGDNLLESLKDGSLTRDRLAEAVKNILSALIKLPATRRALGEETVVNVTGKDYWFDNADNTNASYIIDSDDQEISLVGIDSARGDSYSFGISFAKTGVYKFSLTVEATAALHVPIPASVIINGKPYAMLTFYGINGEVMTSEAIITVNEKNAVYRLFFSHDGLVVKNMRFVFDKDL